MGFVPYHFKRKEMYNEAVRNNLWLLAYVPDSNKNIDFFVSSGWIQKMF